MAMITWFWRNFVDSTPAHLAYPLALSIAVIGFGIAEATRRVIMVRLQRLSAKSIHLGFKQLTLNLLRSTLLLFELSMAMYIASIPLDLPIIWQERLVRWVALIGLFQTGIWGSVVVQYLIGQWVDKSSEAHKDEDGYQAATASGRAIIRFLGRALVWSLTALLILENLGINVSTLLAGLGVTGVAVALATQSIVGDLFASLSILLDQPFLVGDFIVVDNLTGTVERIGVKTTRLRSLTGEMLVISNSDLAKSRLRNYRVMSQRRVAFTINLPFHTSVEKLRNVPTLLQLAVQASQPTQFDRATLSSFADSWVQFEVVYYILTPDYGVYAQVQQQIYLRILESFAKHGIFIGNPTQVVYTCEWDKSPFSKETLQAALPQPRLT